MIKETFADESWQGNFWLRPIVLAHISSDTDLHWFFELYIRRQNKNGELKANEAHMILNNLDTRMKNKIWQTLQNVAIFIIDPEHYLSNKRIKVFNGGIFQFGYENESIIISTSHPNYDSIKKLLQDYLSKIILLDSPASDIDYSMRIISYSIDIYPFIDESDFCQDLILGKMAKTDFRKRIINLAKLSPRLSSAFFELKDPETKNKIFENNFQERRYFSPAYYHLELLCRSISPARFFDEGDRLSISIIKRFQEVISQGLQHPIFNNRYTLSFPKVEELDSRKDIRIQAADVAAGIARNIYERYNIKGLRDRFDYIIFNGNKL